MKSDHSYKHKCGWAFSLLAAFTLLSAGTFWKVLSNPDTVLAFNDGNIEYALMPALQMPQAFQRAWDNQSFFGVGAGQLGLSVINLSEYLFGAHEWRRIGQACFLALCGLAFYWMFRQYRFHRIPSSIAAGILILTGWSNTFALSGLAARPAALAFTALALGFIEYGRQTGKWLPYAIAGGALGLGIAEVPDVGAILAMASAFIFAWTHLSGERGTGAGEQFFNIHQRLRVIPKFALYVAFSALLGWQTITGIVGTQIKGVTQGAAESPESRFAWATQWSVPPSETWNIVSGSYFGASMRSESHPYWGRLGRSEGWETTRQGFRNFAMTGYHLGVVPCILLIALFIYWVRNKRNEGMSAEQKTAKEVLAAYPIAHPRAFTLMIFLGSAAALMLMWGKYFPLYRLLWSLPYMSTIRNPEKWNGPFLLFAILGIAFMLDLLWRQFSSRKDIAHLQTMDFGPRVSDPGLLKTSLLWSSLGLAGISLLILIGTSGGKASLIERLTAEGYGAGAGLAYDNAIAACLKVLVISGIFTGLVMWIFRSRKPEVKNQKPEGKGQHKAKKGLTQAPDAGQQAPGSTDLTVHRPPSTVYLLLALLAILAFGDLFFTNQPYVVGHHYKQLLQPNPLTDYLDAHKGEGRIKLLPPSHGLLNNLRLTLLEIKGYDLFDPISISRMPVDYESFSKSLEKNPVRQWELGAIRYFLTLPGGCAQLNQLDGNRNRFTEKLALGISVVNETYIPVAGAPANQQYLRLVEFKGSLPKNRLVSRATTVPLTPEGYEQALKLLSNPSFNPATEVVLHQDGAAPILQSSGTNSLSLVSESPVETRLTVYSERPCLLIRATKYDANWKVFIDGQCVPLFRANYLFQAALVPSGSHTIMFSYNPPATSLRDAIGLRLLFMLMIGIYLLNGHRSRTAPPGRPGAIHRLAATLWRTLAPSFTISRNFYGLKTYFSFRDNAFYWTRPRKQLETIEPIFDALRGIQGTVWDVGCNVGLFSLRAAQLGNKVIAFDISPMCIRLLARSAQANNLDITTVAQALGITEFNYIPPSGSHTENRLQAPTEGEGQSTLSSVTYRDMASRHGTPNLIKMDIEGAEAAFLADAAFKQWLIQNNIVWVLEIHNPDFRTMIDARFSVATINDIHLVITPKILSK